jgi:hydroxymethylbilane synthase
VTLRIGTRGSALALAQTGDVARDITAAVGTPVDLVTVISHGDVSRASLSSLGGTGVFASALREALVADECDLLVHSLKDLPTQPYDGLVVAGIPQRADARDALCARDNLSLGELPRGAKVGTGSPRRVAQLLAARPDLQIVDIRGNIDSRLARVNPDDLDAIVLAAAGLDRIGRSDAITDLFDLDRWPTAPGQGALALEVRSSDIGGGFEAASRDDAAGIGEQIAAAVGALNDRDAALTATAERGVLATLEAGCAAPVGATAVVQDGTLFLSATVYSTDGLRSVTERADAEIDEQLSPEMLGARVAERLLEAGAASFAPVGAFS